MGFSLGVHVRAMRPDRIALPVPHYLDACKPAMERVAHSIAQCQHRQQSPWWSDGPSGISSHTLPSSSRPSALQRTRPHCLKKKGTRANTRPDRFRQTCEVCRIPPHPLAMVILRQAALHLRRQPGEKGVGAARLHQQRAGAGEVHHQALAVEQAEASNGICGQNGVLDGLRLIAPGADHRLLRGTGAGSTGPPTVRRGCSRLHAAGCITGHSLSSCRVPVYNTCSGVGREETGRMDATGMPVLPGGHLPAQGGPGAQERPMAEVQRARARRGDLCLSMPVEGDTGGHCPSRGTAAAPTVSHVAGSLHSAHQRMSRGDRTI